MTTLMIDAGPVAEDAPVTRTGGVPLAPPGADWPRCATCEGPMQFLAQILLADLGTATGTIAAIDSGADTGLLALFMCQNDPGMCEEWEPGGGGNRALLLPAAGLHPLPLPEPGEDDDEEALLLGAVRAVTYEHAAEADYADASEAWSERTGRKAYDHVLGQLGGTPSWLQHDETPICTACSSPMPLVTQLEEGPDHLTAMNFGSGSAYAFACVPCAQAVFLWQC
ncbi:hypothetical protein CTZ27_32945 [Streptomyces griseocarneus]|nr:hypothetical protein CTZ27_32945 [Streptomyces griseocarneus]